MIGSLSHEIQVKVPAAEAWKVYGTLHLAELVRQELPQVLHGIDLLEGDGGAGTKLQLTFPPGNPIISYSKEKFLVVDDQKLTKIAEVYEGGYLNLGFTLYRVTFQVIPNPNDECSCTTKCILDYEIKEEAAANVSLLTIQPFVYIMNVATDYLLKSSAIPSANATTN